MGLLQHLFGKKNINTEKDERTIPWIRFISLEQLGEIERRSAIKTQLIFKHSTSCGISRMVMNLFAESYDFLENEMDLYYLDLHSYREVSDETGYKFQVRHQSPQLLVVKNGIAVAHASHGAITEIDLRRYV